MARPILAALLLLGMCARTANAQADEDMGAGADLTGVDGTSEAGGMSPASAGPDLTVGSSRAQQPVLTGVWRLLANCESSLNPRAVSAGGTYRGLFQFDQQTWASVGGLLFASRADLASPMDQLVTAQRLQARRGWAPWPWCSRHLGLR
jgi:hypothetical protein